MLLGWRERERERFIHVLNPKLLLLLLFLLLIFSPVSFLVAMMPMQMNLRTNPADPPPPLR
jgi:energy-coupling factor transporter transmembrane protein EcfT